MNDRTRTLLIAICVIVAVSLAPAVLLYLLFGSLSSANVSWLNGDVKLGGPIAAFFATLMFLYRFYARYARTADDAAEMAAPYAGKWHVTAQSSKNQRKASSDIEAIIGANGLSFSGNFLDTAKKPVGEWKTEYVFCAPTGLAYKYWLTDGSSGAKQNWIGFCTLYVAKRGKSARPSRLEGTWDVIGPEHHDGTIAFERQDR